MTWLTAKLKDRIQIRKGIQTDNTEGGFDRTYETLLTIWASVLPSSKFKLNSAAYTRGSQTEWNNLTHTVIVRRIAISALGTAFSNAFGDGFDTISDLRPLKSEYFIFVERGTTTKGTLLRIHNIVDNDERREFLNLKCEEIEEQGTGFPE